MHKKQLLSNFLIVYSTNFLKNIDVDNLYGLKKIQKKPT
jgi:hypothetical protein